MWFSDHEQSQLMFQIFVYSAHSVNRVRERTSTKVLAWRSASSESNSKFWDSVIRNFVIFSFISNGWNFCGKITHLQIISEFFASTINSASIDKHSKLISIQLLVGRKDRASTSEMVDSGSILNWVKTKDDNNWYSQLTCLMLSMKRDNMKLPPSVINSWAGGSLTPRPKGHFVVSWPRQLTWRIKRIKL